MKKTTILFTIWSFGYGGAERFVLNIIKRLSKEKYSFIIFSDSQKDGPLMKEFVEAGAKVYSATYHRFKHPIRHRKELMKIIIEENVDIVHANDDLNMIFPLLANKRRAIFIAHSHNTVFRFTNNKIISFALSHLIKRYISRHADYRVGCSDLAGIALFGKRKYSVILNGIELDRFSFNIKKRMDLRQTLNIQEDSVVILNIGRLVKQKNHEFLIEVFRKFNERKRNSYLVIIGDGVDREKLRQKADESGVGEKIFILSGRKDVSDYYNLADFFVMPSLYEGMPMTSIEAQANGLKCIFSNAITKEADHNGASIFLPLSCGPEKWSDIMLNLDTKRNTNACGKIIEYDIREVTKKVDDLYKRISRR